MQVSGGKFHSLEMAHVSMVDPARVVDDYQSEMSNFAADISRMAQRICA
jgi:hypothetical protein